MYSKIVITVLLIITVIKLSQQLPTPTPLKNILNDKFSVCNKTSRCYSLPENCTPTENDCFVSLAVTPKGNGAHFDLYFNRTSQEDQWVGVALSDDKMMGEDSVTECIVLRNNSVITRQGFTSPYPKGVRTVEVKGVTEQKISFSDNSLFCSWSRSAETVVSGRDFNITNNKYFIFIAVGPLQQDKDELGRHRLRWTSSEADVLGAPIKH